MSRQIQDKNEKITTNLPKNQYLSWVRKPVHRSQPRCPRRSLRHPSILERLFEFLCKEELKRPYAACEDYVSTMKIANLLRRPCFERSVPLPGLD